ncbi:hypothetical protein [Komagataeibacter rhaeticus]|uniref:Uncharacterized protein n=1 Tax=Komagataeibacter rhaeticus TaxID=215221 RepID=A0A858JR42_9PROT|nr:hypothetical protein [Komagataeibacter rhaeticus]QIP36343.1 hypothetical protein GWK63_13385 [Komagataeibacter rhaeticus]QOC46107.1 hypothetical protein ICJ78_13460 [Komagataeibacter rhaeticus]
MSQIFIVLMMIPKQGYRSALISFFLRRHRAGVPGRENRSVAHVLSGMFHAFGGAINRNLCGHCRFFHAVFFRFRHRRAGAYGSGGRYVMDMHEFIRFPAAAGAGRVRYFYDLL